MSGLKYALAMLGAGGAVAMASDAAASTIVTLDLSPYDAPVDINLFMGSPAQFYYGAGTAKVAPFTDGPAAVLGTYGDSTVGTSMPLLGLVVPGPTQTSGQVKLGALVPTGPEGFAALSDPGVAFIGPGFDQYVSLTFKEGGTTYAGTAHVDSTGYLRTIEYEAAGVVPEPASWALMIGGFGLAGAALRARRRQAAVSA
jgi:hypothetical protein